MKVLSKKKIDPVKAASLRLFNSIIVDKEKKYDISESVTIKTIKNGYILDGSINPQKQTLEAINSIVGISGEKANAAFHKSWKIIEESSEQDLYAQQIIHYFTTYGLESMGLYNSDFVYIPNEKLEIPGLTEDIPLTVIKGLTSKEILQRIISLGCGVALSSETLDDIMTIIIDGKYSSEFVDKISNRELKARLCDYFNIVPKEPVDYLRYVISKLTDESLIIKNDQLIGKIKSSNGKFLDQLIIDAPKNLASIFYRYKPLFLAMKSISNNKTFFNRLRKDAKKMHVPLKEDYMNSITSKIKHKILDEDEFAKRLEKASVFRKIRLAYALKARLRSLDSIVYKVRNGRGWATGFDWPAELYGKTKSALDLTLGSISEDMKSNVEGKTYYIPENICYALPATEKQFTGNIPSGSYVRIPNDDIIIGVHWHNTERRIDLDLSVIGESGKIGWDANYKSKNNDVLFSGDVTDAPEPNGATELFYFKNSIPEARIIMVNYFNFSASDPVSCKIIAAKEKATNFGNNYMVDINNIVASANTVISQRQTILGLVTNIDNENRLYFNQTSVGNSISSSSNEYTTQSRKYLFATATGSFHLASIIKNAGGIVVNNKPDEEYVDLSPENLDKSTILSIFQDTID